MANARGRCSVGGFRTGWWMQRINLKMKRKEKKLKLKAIINQISNYTKKEN